MPLALILLGKFNIKYYLSIPIFQALFVRKDITLPHFSNIHQGMYKHAALIKL